MKKIDKNFVKNLNPQYIKKHGRPKDKTREKGQRQDQD